MVSQEYDAIQGGVTILRNLMVGLMACTVVLMEAHAKQTVEGAAPQETETVSRIIPSKEVVYRFDRNVGRGRVVRSNNGQDGSLTIIYRIERDATGKVISRTKIDEVRVEPQPTIYRMGTQGFSTSRSSFRRSSVRIMESTAYDPSAGRGAAATFRTRIGLPAKFGVVAVDPRVIPLRTHLFVEGYGFALAADTGGAIKGNKIDVCVPTAREARQWGRRKVKVHIFHR